MHRVSTPAGIRLMKWICNQSQPLISRLLTAAAAPSLASAIPELPKHKELHLSACASAQAQEDRGAQPFFEAPKGIYSSPSQDLCILTCSFSVWRR